MEVTRYLFQSPSTNKVQVGTPDPSSKKEADTQKQTQKQTEQLTKETNTAIKKAETFVASQTKEVKPVVAAKATTQTLAATELKVENDTKVNPQASGVGQANQAKNEIWSKGSDTAEKIRENIWTKGSNKGHANNIWSRGNSEENQIDKLQRGHKVQPTIETFKDTLSSIDLLG